MNHYRNGNYCAFYVAEPFPSNSLGAHTARDFNHYHLLTAWSARDQNFQFNDSHEKTYNVRDGSNWETTLKPRLHLRLNKSKNIILFLSAYTKASQALTEEIDYGINTLGLPTIVIYPDHTYSSNHINSSKNFTDSIKELWIKLPAFKNSMHKIPTLHIPMNKEIIKTALIDKGFMVTSDQKNKAGIYTTPKINR